MKWLEQLPKGVGEIDVLTLVSHSCFDMSRSRWAGWKTYFPGHGKLPAQVSELPPSVLLPQLLRCRSSPPLIPPLATEFSSMSLNDVCVTCLHSDDVHSAVCRKTEYDWINEIRWTTEDASWERQGRHTCMIAEATFVYNIWKRRTWSA